MELLGGEGADRLQEPVAPRRRPRRAPAPSRPASRARRAPGALVGRVADLLHRLERPAFVEAGEPAQQPLLVRVEERVAPADRRAERPLPQRQVAIAGGEEVQGVVEPLEESRGLEDPRAGGGQLEGERQAVEPAADLGDRRGVGLAQREAGLDLRGPLDEERHGRAAPERVERLGAGRGQLERRQAELGLGADLERRAAGGDDAQPRATRDERGDVLRRVQHLLEVVEHEQHVAASDHRPERVESRAALRLGNREGGRDRGQHVRSPRSPRRARRRPRRPRGRSRGG